MYINLTVLCGTGLILHVVIRDFSRLLPLASRSVNPRFELPTVFIIKYFINPSMEYLIPIWLPSVSKIVQNIVEQGFHTAAVIVRQWAPPFVCTRE